jgi:exosortase
VSSCLIDHHNLGWRVPPLLRHKSAESRGISVSISVVDDSYSGPLLDAIVRVLQRGSTEVGWLIFKAVQLPVFRSGFVLAVPGVTIEVGKECSSIRSSLALLITCILAAHLYLRTWWKAVLFVVLSLPLSVIKNGIRIATLTS